MSLPEVLDAELDGEPAVAEVPLGGEDLLVVTPSRTLVYRDDGLLSDEAVEAVPHDAERLSLSVGRRKAKLTLDYGLDGSETLSLPASHIDDAIHPILAGILNAAGVTDPGETVLKTFRFSDLTLVVTSDQIVKHIGGALWTEDFETFGYDGVTDIDFEEGTHATSIVITHGGRQERFKAPNDDVRAVRETIVGAVCEYHGVESVDEIEPNADTDAGGDSDGGDSEGDDTLDFGAGLDPLSTDPDDLSEPSGETEAASTDDPESMSDESLAASIGEGDDSVTDSTADSGGEAAVAATTAESGAADGGAAASTADEPAGGFEESGFESAGPVEDDSVAEQIDVLVERVERQERKLERQTELLETLIEELRRGR
ncbi:MAG: hypothetical protein A07HN63_01677 [uncultured archaeon A07HN63]|nr:MAG: hypothetical protein A07HN63_01677 [uncultured archaeon A07HN63]